VDLSGPALDDLKRRAKRQLRQRMRALRGAIPESALQARNAAIVERVLALPEVGRAGSIALFWPMEDKGEVDLRTVDRCCRARGVKIYYPSGAGRQGKNGTFRLTMAATELAEAGRGFLEPPEDAPEALPGDLGVVVVPALAVSEFGHRIGYGAGFYDALLPSFCPPALSVVVAHDFGLLSELPTHAWDVPCDVVVTDARVRRRTAG
jgi:5-formyltetrahydrofolate cyclo-ligase